MLTFQQIIFKLQNFWAAQGCVVLQPFDMEVGAGTSHPATCLRALGPEPWFAAYVQPSRRPKDGRYGDNPNRLQHYYQFQVALKPAPENIQELYLDPLKELGMGWEVWLNGMEVTQFTYFQQVGGIDCTPVLGEITYGIERLAMYLQGVENVYDLVWAHTPDGQTVTYGDVYHQNEVEQSTYNFEYANVDLLLQNFNNFEAEARRLLEIENASLILPAYEQVLKAGHTFNMLDARGAISVTERATYIGRIRNLSRIVAQKFVESREALGYPLIKNKTV